MRSPADLQAIANELNTNPLGLTGYFPVTDDTKDVANRDALNLVRPEVTVTRQDVTARDIWQCITRTDWGNTAAADRTWVAGQLSGDSVLDLDPGVFRTGMLQIYTAGTATKDNFEAKLLVATSRIQQMFRQGIVQDGSDLSPSDISDARNATT